MTENNKKVERVSLSLVDGYRNFAILLFDNGDKAVVDANDSGQIAVSAAPYIDNATIIEDHRFPSRTFESFLKEPDDMMKGVIEEYAKVVGVYNPAVHGVITAIEIQPTDDPNKPSAMLAFAFGGKVVVDWTEEGVKEYLPGINGYTMFYDLRARRKAAHSA